MDAFEHLNDDELLEHTATEPEAFGTFYRRHIGGVLGFFRRRTGDAQLALDLAAETFARALEHAGRFEPGSSPPAAWLYAIARNLLRDAYRRGRVEDDARRRLALEPLVVTDLGFERVEAAIDAARLLAEVETSRALSEQQVAAVQARPRRRLVPAGRNAASLLATGRPPARLPRPAEPQTTDGEPAVITDDPIADLGRQLVEAARRATRSAASPVTPRPRRRLVLAAPAAALAALAVLLLVLLTDGAGRRSIVDAAAAQLNPRSGIVHVAYDVRFYDGGKLYQHARTETWYSATRERMVSTSIGPRSGRRVRSLEVVRTADRIVSYESGANTLTSQATCKPSSLSSRSANVDPLAMFVALHAGHRFTPKGTTTFDGRQVTRLVAARHGLHLAYLVAPRTGAPVALTTRPAGLLAPRGAPLTGTVVRFLRHQRLPLDSSTRHLLTMSDHAGAKTISLGRSRCAGR